jgi:hypothetical protein
MINKMFKVDASHIGTMVFGDSYVRDLQKQVEMKEQELIDLHTAKRNELAEAQKQIALEKESIQVILNDRANIKKELAEAGLLIQSLVKEIDEVTDDHGCDYMLPPLEDTYCTVSSKHIRCAYNGGKCGCAQNDKLFIKPKETLNDN